MKDAAAAVCVCDQADQLAAEVATERSKAQQLEAERSGLERQNKELRAKLDEMELQQKARLKASQQAFDSKVANLEEQLDAEMRLVVISSTTRQ